LFYSDSYIEGDIGKQKFLFLVLLFVISIIFMILGANIVIILLGWDGLGLVSYCLVVYYQNDSSSRAGIITVLTNRVGDVGILLSVVFIINFGRLDFLNFIFSNELLNYVGIFILMGAVTKRAQIPFSAWLPAAIAAPTPVSSLVHSSTLVTAGVYLIIRLRIYFRNGGFSYILMFVSILTIFIAGLRANFEIDLKKIIALSTLSQLGVIILILSIGSYDLAFFHLVIHAVFKAILFLCAGIVIHGLRGGQDIRLIGVNLNLSPAISRLLILSRLSLGGFPFLRGFYSKDLILEVIYIINNRYLYLVFIIMSTMFTVIYSLRLVFYRIWGGNLGFTCQGYYEVFFIVRPVFLIGVFVVFFGSFFSWLIFPHPIFIHLLVVVKLINLLLIF